MSAAFDESGPVESVDFDYAEVDRRLAGVETDQSADPAQPELRNLEAWLCSARGRVFFGPTITRKMAVLRWLVLPDKSLAALAAEHGCSKSAMSRHAAQAARVFGMRCRPQILHGGRWRKSRSTKS